VGIDEEDSTILEIESLSDGKSRRADDKIPSAYKLWMQQALDQMRPSPQMIDEIKKAIGEANEVLIHKINNNVMKAVGEVQIDLANYKTEQATHHSKESERIATLESQSKTLKWVVGVSAVILCGCFTLVSIFAT